MDPNYRPLEHATAASRSLEQAHPPQVTTIRNVDSPHGRCWLGVGHRGLVPITSVPEIEGWSGSTSTRPTAGLCRRYLQRMDLTLKVMKLKRAGEATAFFGMLSCELKSGLGHSNAMPVIPARQRTGATD